MFGTASRFDFVVGAVGHRVRRCHQISVALFNDEVGRFELTSIQYAALAAVAAHDDIDATRLAGLVAFDRTTVGHVLQRLEIKGYIEREHRFHDKRSKRLRTTPAGRSILLDADGAVHRSQARFLDVLEPAKRDILLHLLKTVIDEHEDLNETVQI